MDPTPDVQGFSYDAYLCFAQANGERIERDFIKPWRDTGLRIATFYDIPREGDPVVEEIERAVVASRYTVVFMSPDYFSERISKFADSLAQYMNIEKGGRRFKIALLEPMPRTDIPWRFRSQTMFDFTISWRFDRYFQELSETLRTVPQTTSATILAAPADETFAARLRSDLRNNGVRVWFARDDLKIGDPIRSTIDASIRRGDKLIVVLSENSMQDPWIRAKITGLLEKETPDDQPALFPLRLDDAVIESSEPWAATLRELYMGDFTKSDNPLLYQNSINRLLRDLNANG